MQHPSNPGLRPRTLAAAIGLALAASGAQAATFQVTSTADAGAGTLRAAIEAGNGQAGPHLIDFSPIVGQTITLAGDLPVISEEMTLQGSEVTISGDDQYRCLSADSVDLGVSDMTITQCVGTEVGGIQGNPGPYSYRAGGGVFAYSGDVSLSEVTIEGNTAYSGGYGYGGGVAVVNGSLTVTNGSTISGNSSGYGGGIAHVGPQLLIQDSVISDNSAYQGGGIANRPPQQVDRGGLYYGLSIENSIISGNQASLGGGIDSVGALSLIDTEVSDNSAVYAGGGLFTRSYGMPVRGVAETFISGSAITNNSAGYEAGGAMLTAKYGLVMENTTVSGNTAQEVGGLYTETGSGGFPVLFDGVTVTDNSATAGPFGGMLVLSRKAESQVDISNSIIAGNSATEGDADLGGGFLDQPESATQALAASGEQTGRRSLMAREAAARGAWSADLAVPSMTSRLEGWRRGVQPPPPGGPTPTTFDVIYSLVGAAPTIGTFNTDAPSGALLGANPQLGSLGDNGGPTPSHLPATTGPGVDLIPSGQSGCGNDFVVDQRGEPRPEIAGGLCDVGSVELQGTAPPPAPISVPVNHPVAIALLALGAGLLGFLALGRARRRV